MVRDGRNLGYGRLTFFFQSIRVEKLIGDKMDLRCQEGGIFSQSLYCQEGKVVCNGGQIDLSNLHGRFSVHTAKAKIVHLSELGILSLMFFLSILVASRMYA